jgi:hypothetical protein
MLNRIASTLRARSSARWKGQIPSTSGSPHASSDCHNCAVAASTFKHGLINTPARATLSGKTVQYFVSFFKVLASPFRDTAFHPPANKPQQLLRTRGPE